MSWYHCIPYSLVTVQRPSLSQDNNDKRLTASTDKPHFIVPRCYLSNVYTRWCFLLREINSKRLLGLYLTVLWLLKSVYLLLICDITNPCRITSIACYNVHHAQSAESCLQNVLWDLTYIPWNMHTHGFALLGFVLVNASALIRLLCYTKAPVHMISPLRVT